MVKLVDAGDGLLMWSWRTLDLGLDIVDGVGRLHLKGDSLTRNYCIISIACARWTQIVLHVRVLTKICILSRAFAFLNSADAEEKFWLSQSHVN